MSAHQPVLLLALKNTTERLLTLVLLDLFNYTSCPTYTMTFEQGSRGPETDAARLQSKRCAFF